MAILGFCGLLVIPERTWRCWRARARVGQPVKGPWPAPSRDRHRAAVVSMASKYPAWGHRQIWAMVRHDGHRVSPSTVVRITTFDGLLLRVDDQKQRRELARQRKTAVAAPLRVRIRCGSSTSSTTRPLAVGPGGSPGSRTTSARTSSDDTGHRQRRTVPLVPVRARHHRSPRAAPRPCPASAHPARTASANTPSRV